MGDHIIVTDEDGDPGSPATAAEKKNALTQDMYSAMSHAIDTAQNNPAIRCLIITGGSGVFSAGNDLDDFLKASRDKAERPTTHQVPAFAGAERQTDHRRGRRHRDRNRNCHFVPLRLCARQHDGDVSTPFIQFGLVPEGASSLLMPQMMGHQRAFSPCWRWAVR